MFCNTFLTVSLVAAFVASVPGTLALPLNKRAVIGPVINQNFPDPGIMRNAADGVWYAYSTSSGGKNIPVAKSADFKSWSIVGEFLLRTAVCSVCLMQHDTT